MLSPVALPRAVRVVHVASSFHEPPLYTSFVPHTVTPPEAVPARRLPLRPHCALTEPHPDARPRGRRAGSRRRGSSLLGITNSFVLSFLYKSCRGISAPETL